MFEVGQKVKLLRTVEYGDDDYDNADVYAFVQAGSIGEVMEVLANEILVGFVESIEWVNVEELEPAE